MPRRGNSLERILGRIDDLDPGNLAILVQRLAREREMLETVFNTIKDGILVADRQGVIQYANAAARALIGLREPDVGTALLWKVMPATFVFMSCRSRPIASAVPRVALPLS